MSLLLPCPACGENRKADEGHSICRQCEGYAPADGSVSGGLTAEVEAIAASVYPAVFSGRSDVGPATRARRRGVLRDVEKMIQALDSLRASRQERPPEGDRQLTAEAFSHKEIQTLMAAMAGNHPASLAEYRLPVLRKLARAAGPGAQGPWSEKDVRRLASGENPE